MTLRRGLVLGPACAATLLFGGCSVEGTLTIESADRVAVDITVSDLSASSCDEYARAVDLGLLVTPVVGAPRLTCHFTGYVDAEQLRKTNIALSEVGEHLVLGFDPWGADNVAEEAKLSGLPAFDVTVNFPGPVLRSSGTASGNQARFLRDDLLEPLGLIAVGQAHGGPPWWLLALGLGVLGGAGAGGLAGWLLASRRGRPSEEPEATHDDDFPDDPDEPRPDAAESPRTDVDDSVWAPPEPPMGGSPGVPGSAP